MADLTGPEPTVDCWKCRKPVPVKTVPMVCVQCAAAPDLLEAAKHAAMEWRLHGQLTDSCRVLERAIAKAEGRLTSDPWPADVEDALLDRMQKNKGGQS